MDQNENQNKFENKFVHEFYNYKATKFSNSRVKPWPFKDSSFDVVLSIAVIHHLSTEERRLDAMQEIRRVLKPDGLCLIYLWHKDASVKSKFSKLLDNDSEYLVSWSGENDLLRYYCLFDEYMMRKLAENSNMKILELGREQESLYAVLQMPSK